MDLFSLSAEVGRGLVLWHPKGAVVRSVIEDFWKKEHVKRGYKYVYTPHIGKANLWKKSGHLEFFKDSMYGPIKVEDKEYRIKPMNCPFHLEIYKSHKRSYKEN